MPAFPKVPGVATERDGLRLFALQVKHQVEGEDIFIDVSLMYGNPRQKIVPVARFPASEYLRPRDPDDEVVELRALLRMFEPTHVLASTRATQRTVVALTAREPTLVLADSLPGGGLVYRSR